MPQNRVDEWRSLKYKEQEALVISLMSQMNLKSIIKDRKWRFRKYRSCLVGKKVVKYLLESGIAVDKFEAIAIGQMMMRVGYLEHVVQEHDFKDEFLFYRYIAEEERELRKRMGSPLGRAASERASILGSAVPVTFEEAQSVLNRFDARSASLSSVVLSRQVQQRRARGHGAAQSLAALKQRQRKSRVNSSRLSESTLLSVVVDTDFGDDEDSDDSKDDDDDDDGDDDDGDDDDNDDENVYYERSNLCISLAGQRLSPSQLSVLAAKLAMRGAGLRGLDLREIATMTSDNVDELGKALCVNETLQALDLRGNEHVNASLKKLVRRLLRNNFTLVSLAIDDASTDGDESLSGELLVQQPADASMPTRSSSSSSSSMAMRIALMMSSNKSLLKVEEALGTEVRLHRRGLKALPERRLREITSSSGCSGGVRGHVHELDAQHNRIVELPDRLIRRLAGSLRVLNLSHNCIDVLPASIGLLGALERLDVSHNRLSSLPDTVCCLRLLRHLDVSHNALSSPLPIGLAGIEALEWLSAAENAALTSFYPKRLIVVGSGASDVVAAASSSEKLAESTSIEGLADVDDDLGARSLLDYLRTRLRAVTERPCCTKLNVLGCPKSGKKTLMAALRRYDVGAHFVAAASGAGARRHSVSHNPGGGGGDGDIIASASAALSSSSALQKRSMGASKLAPMQPSAATAASRGHSAPNLIDELPSDQCGAYSLNVWRLARRRKSPLSFAVHHWPSTGFKPLHPLWAPRSGIFVIACSMANSLLYISMSLSFWLARVRSPSYLQHESPVILVATNSDARHLSKQDVADRMALFEKWSMRFPDSVGTLSVSSVTGDGVAALHQMLVDVAMRMEWNSTFRVPLGYNALAAMLAARRNVCSEPFMSTDQFRVLAVEHGALAPSASLAELRSLLDTLQTQGIVAHFLEPLDKEATASPLSPSDGGVMSLDHLEALGGGDGDASNVEAHLAGIDVRKLSKLVVVDPRSLHVLLSTTEPLDNYSVFAIFADIEVPSAPTFRNAIWTRKTARCIWRHAMPARHYENYVRILVKLGVAYPLTSDPFGAVDGSDGDAVRRRASTHNVFGSLRLLLPSMLPSARPAYESSGEASLGRIYHFRSMPYSFFARLMHRLAASDYWQPIAVWRFGFRLRHADASGNARRTLMMEFEPLRSLLLIKVYGVMQAVTLQTVVSSLTSLLNSWPGGCVYKVFVPCPCSLITSFASSSSTGSSDSDAGSGSGSGSSSGSWVSRRNKQRSSPSPTSSASSLSPPVLDRHLRTSQSASSGPIASSSSSSDIAGDASDVLYNPTFSPPRKRRSKNRLKIKLKRRGGRSSKSSAVDMPPRAASTREASMSLVSLIESVDPADVTPHIGDDGVARSAASTSLASHALVAVEPSLRRQMSSSSDDDDDINVDDDIENDAATAKKRRKSVKQANAKLLKKGRAGNLPPLSIEATQEVGMRRPQRSAAKVLNLADMSCGSFTERIDRSPSSPRNEALLSARTAALADKVDSLGGKSSWFFGLSSASASRSASSGISGTSSTAVNDARLEQLEAEVRAQQSALSLSGGRAQRSWSHSDLRSLALLDTDHSDIATKLSSDEPLRYELADSDTTSIRSTAVAGAVSKVLRQRTAPALGANDDKPPPPQKVALGVSASAASSSSSPSSSPRLPLVRSRSIGTSLADSGDDDVSAAALPIVPANMIKGPTSASSMSGDSMSSSELDATNLPLAGVDGLSDEAINGLLRAHVVVKTRKYHFRSYRNCFVASEAASLLAAYARLSRREATKRLKRLQDAGYIQHVTDADKAFEDDFLFYRFGKHRALCGRVDLDALQEAARSELQIEDRRYALRTYWRSFVAHDAVDWLAARERFTRAEAVQLFQQLVERGAIAHVINSATAFSDSFQLFTFVDTDAALDLILPERTEAYTLFPLEYLEFLSANGRATVTCTRCDHELRIDYLAPDIVLTTQMPTFSYDELSERREIGAGAYACVEFALYSPKKLSGDNNAAVSGGDNNDDNDDDQVPGDDTSDKGEQRQVVLKRLNMGESLRSDQQVALFAEYRHEAWLQLSLKHRNIVKLIAVSDGDPFGFLLEYMNLGDLHGYIASRKPLGYFQRLRIATHVARALRFLHSRYPSIVHCDLKSPNILLTRRPNGLIVAKVSDFGLSQSLGFAPKLRRDVAQDNPTWAAPEDDISTQADIYALGIVMWELLCWQQPWADVHFLHQIEELVAAGQRPKLPDNPHASLKPWIELMQQCWHADPCHRPPLRRTLSRLRSMERSFKLLGKEHKEK
jgi:Protein tyrosine and serine/threonine kinase/Domain found in Dishevelled, Egl-10, and Pleckstrin (DEP)/Leucine rich repeat